jgi:hypothetical protein
MDEPTVEQIAMMAAHLYNPNDKLGITLAVRLAFQIWDVTVEKMNERDEQAARTQNNP